MALLDCTRCKTSGSIECDPIDGFLICTACGFIADESSAWLYNPLELLEENQAFANVDSKGRAKGEIILHGVEWVHHIVTGPWSTVTLVLTPQVSGEGIRRRPSVMVWGSVHLIPPALVSNGSGGRSNSWRGLAAP